MSVTRLALTRAIAKDLGLGYAQLTPSTGGSTTTTVCTSAGGPLDADDANALFASAWEKVEADSAGTPLNVGEVRRIDASGYVASTGTITHRAFTNATTTTMTVGIYFGIPPSDHGIYKGITSYIDERLRNLFYKDLWLLTDVTDGDMETSGTTNYSGTNASLAKVTSGAGVTAGDQALQVTTTAANGYCTLATALNGTEGEVKEIVVDVKPTSGIWKLQAWDVTAGAEIDVTSTYDGVQPRRLWLRVTIPTDCETWNVRLIGETDATVAVFDNLSIRDAQQKFHNLPSWVIRPEWLEEVWVYPPGTDRNNAYAIGEWGRYSVTWWDVQESYTGNQAMRLEADLSGVPHGSHVFFSALRTYGELATDSATTDADQDFIKYCCLMDIYADMGDKKNFDRAARRFKELGLGRHVPKLNRRAFKPPRMG